MQFWDLTTAGADGSPGILASTDEGRAIVVSLAPGEELADHQVHERAWVLLTAGSIQVRTTAELAEAELSAPALVTFAPSERHAVRARSDATLLLLLTPWPGDGHPGATALDAKAKARELARARPA